LEASGSDSFSEDDELTDTILLLLPPGDGFLKGSFSFDDDFGMLTDLMGLLLAQVKVRFGLPTIFFLRSKKLTSAQLGLKMLTEL